MSATRFRGATVVASSSDAGRVAAAGALLGASAGLVDKLDDGDLHAPRAAAEMQQRRSPDLPALLEPTGDAVAVLFAHTAVVAGRPDNASALAACGSVFGRLVHLLDAVEDFMTDRAAGRFNLLSATGTDVAAARALVDVLIGAELTSAVHRAFPEHPAAAQAIPAQRQGERGAWAMAVAAWSLLAPAVIIGGGWSGGSWGGRRRRRRHAGEDHQLTARRPAGVALCAALLSAACTSSPEPSAQVSPAPASPAPSVTAPVTQPPAVPTPPTYLALGDSVAAGVGAPAPATGGYVPLLAGRLSDRLGCDDGPAPGCPLSVRNLAQSGATTATLLRSQMPPALEVLRTAPDVRLVTLTIGGNDVVEAAVRGCAPDPAAPACGRAVVSALGRADTGITEVLRTLATAAGPGTTIAVMAYYNSSFACQLASLQPLAERLLEGAGSQPGLNDILRARAADHSVLVVETGERLSTRGDFVGGNDCLHPSGAGHARIAEAFLEVVGDPVTRR